MKQEKKNLKFRYWRVVNPTYIRGVRKKGKLRRSQVGSMIGGLMSTSGGGPVEGGDFLSKCWSIKVWVEIPGIGTWDWPVTGGGETKKRVRHGGRVGRCRKNDHGGNLQNPQAGKTSAEGLFREINFLLPIKNKGVGGKKLFLDFWSENSHGPPEGGWDA